MNTTDLAMLLFIEQDRREDSLRQFWMRKLQTHPDQKELINQILSALWNSNMAEVEKLSKQFKS